MSPLARARGLFGALRDAGRTTPAVDPASMRRNLAAIGALRGGFDWLDRFAPTTVDGGAGRLNLEIGAADDAWGTLVFVPGTNAYALMYGQALSAMLDRGLNVVGLDPRGHGASDGRRGSYTLTELLDDLDRAIAHARQRFGGPIFVGGSSQGGIAAFYTAAERRDLAGAVCHNIADLGAPDRVRLSRLEPVGRMAEPLVRGLARLLPELPVPMTVYLDLAREPVIGLGNARDALYGDPALYPCVRLRALASLSGTPLPVPVDAITTPVLVLHGGGDTLFPTDYVEGLYRRLPGDRHGFRLYPGLPHYLVVDHVDAWIDDVVDWMRDRVAR